ncbi:hypothetical protein [Desulfospira joergensenii]|nr:hypothetical protein [Desulfospira joergensenii]
MPENKKISSLGKTGITVYNSTDLNPEAEFRVYGPSYINGVFQKG